jgi:hypothetical protein
MVSVMPEPDPTVRARRWPAITGDSLPPTLRWSVRLLLAQAAGMAGVVVLLGYEDLTAHAAALPSALMVTVFAAFLSAVLVGLARALSRRRAWARGPAIVLELLLVPIGYSMAGSGLPWLGVPLILVGLGTAGALLAFPTRSALGLR